MVDNVEVDKRIKKPSKYTCTGKTKVHHFIVDSPAGKPTVNAKCKYCQFERTHNITEIDVQASGRKAYEKQRKAKKRGANIKL